MRKGGTEGLRKWKKWMQCCSFLFLSHCIWRSVPLLISTVGTRRFECWEFKQRLLGRWQLWCLSCVCMFWNVKCPLKCCFQLCFSSPEDGLFINITGFYKTQTTLCLESGTMDYRWLSPVRMNTCLQHKSHSYIHQCTDGIKMQLDGSVQLETLRDTALYCISAHRCWCSTSSALIFAWKDACFSGLFFCLFSN